VEGHIPFHQFNLGIGDRGGQSSDDDRRGPTRGFAGEKAGGVMNSAAWGDEASSSVGRCVEAMRRVQLSCQRQEIVVTLSDFAEEGSAQRLSRTRRASPTESWKRLQTRRLGEL
jgi:hypothetical protein